MGRRILKKAFLKELNRKRENIISLSELIMDEWGSMMARIMLPAFDSFIAATALHLNLTLITGNESGISTGLASVL